MKKVIKSYFSLRLVEYCTFMDVVISKPVSTYVDCYGEYWLKTSRWAFFRVESKRSGTRTERISSTTINLSNTPKEKI